MFCYRVAPSVLNTYLSDQGESQQTAGTAHSQQKQLTSIALMQARKKINQ